MSLYYKTKTYRMRLIIFIMLCAITINIVLPISVSASELQPIMGETIVTKEEMVEYYRENFSTSYPQEYIEKDIDIERFVHIIMEEASAEGVRADVAFAQILEETDWLTFNGEVEIEQNNFGGLKDSEGNYLSFSSIEEGIRANIQILKGHASLEPLNQDKVTFLYDLINSKGMITHVEDLGNGNWSVNFEYGENIKQYLVEMINIYTTPTPEVVLESPLDLDIPLDIPTQTEKLDTLEEKEKPQEIESEPLAEVSPEPKTEDTIPVEVKTLTIDGSGDVGASHRIRSYGTSANGVLYQFWVKDLSKNKWTMIQDYSKSSAPWTPTKAGKYLYGVHIKDEKSNARLDTHLYQEITIKDMPVEVKTLTLAGSGYVGGSHRIRSYGTSNNGVLYQFWVKDLSANKWTMIQDYSKSSAPWTPTKAGNYLYGVHIKDEKSNAKLDKHLYKEVTIKPAVVKSLNINGTGYVGDAHSISSYGNSLDGVLYQFWVKDLSANKWTMIQDYSKNMNSTWTPTKAGKYLYGVHIKDIGSNKRLDDHLYKPINIDNDIVDRALKSYKEMKIDYRPRTKDYDVFGDYLNYGKTKRFVESSDIKFDEKGIPKVRYGENFYYNPVTISQYAFMKYGQYINNNNETCKLEFLTAVDKLVEMQDKTGAFRYDFTWKYYLTGEYYKPGWVSGMAQGQALSALARAYYITEDTKYLDAGNKAVEFLNKDVKNGGTKSTLEDLRPSFKEYIFFEEYVSTPNNYTLNGYMFTLLGLYDWKVITDTYQPENENLAGQYYESGIKTLEVILPFYDLDGFSAYDLGHITFNKEPHIGVRYHAVHINLLHALDSIEDNKTLKKYEELWKSYVDDL